MGGKGKDRKKKSSQSGRQAAQRRGIQQRRTEERIRSLRLRLLSAADASATAGRLTEAFADRDRVATAYDAEAVLSSATGLMPQAGFTGDRLRDACLDICDVLAVGGTPHGIGILRAFAVVGPGPVVRDHARTLADAAGRAAPAWAAELGQAVPGKCWTATDPYGESTSLLCEFSYPAGTDRHAILARVDPIWHGAVSSLAAVDLAGGGMDAGAMKDALKLAGDMSVDLRDVPPPEAARLLRVGLDALAQHGPAPWTKRDSQDFRSTCALTGLARQRVRVLATGAGNLAHVPELATGTVASPWPPEERERLIAEFSRAPQSRDLTSVVARFLARDLVMLCADYLGTDPLRPGPLLFRRLLRDVIPTHLVLPARVAADVPPVIRAWAHWTADRADLPKRLRRRFLSELEDDLREFPSALATASQTPHNRYFQDLPDDVISDDPRCQRALQARHLAIPLPHDRAPGAEILDPAEPAGRARITELYLAGRGIPHEQWGAYRAVAENLWSGDQPKLAEQALRLAAEGLSRDVILDKLVEDG